MQRIAILLIAAGSLVAAILVHFGAYSSILLLLHKRAEARVVSYSQDPKGMIREGDWRLRYEFQDDGGSSHLSEATFPPKRRPRNDVRTITVRYVPFAPSISGVEGNISATGFAAFFMAGLLIMRGISALAKSRVSEHDNPPDSGKPRI